MHAEQESQGGDGRGIYHREKNKRKTREYSKEFQEQQTGNNIVTSKRLQDRIITGPIFYCF